MSDTTQATQLESIPTEDVFKMKLTEFQNSKRALKLRERYRPKTLEEKYSTLYVVIFISSLICQIVSAITGGIFLFDKFLGALPAVPGAIIGALLLTGIVAGVLEVILRIVTPEFYKDWIQFDDWDWRKLGVISVLGIGSIVISCLGSPSAIRLAEPPPPLHVASLENLQEIESQYKTKKETARNIAESFRESKEWRGRLSGENGTKYHSLLAEVNRLENERSTKKEEARKRNEAEIKRIQGANDLQKAEYLTKTSSRGFALGIISFFCYCFFFGSLYWMEKYNYNCYSQFGKPVVKTPPGADIVSSMQIPFQTQSKQESAPVRSILHEGDWLSENEVDNRIRKYSGRVTESLQKGDYANLPNRLEKYVYWVGRKSEFSR